LGEDESVVVMRMVGVDDSYVDDDNDDYNDYNDVVLGDDDVAAAFYLICIFPFLRVSVYSFPLYLLAHRNTNFISHPTTLSPPPTLTVWHNR